jgi:hypothetical protein
MSRQATTFTLFVAFMLASAALAASCAGTSGGGTIAPPPEPSSSPGLGGTAQVATGGSYPNYTYNAAANAGVVFSCGCTKQAGTATASIAGAFVLTAVSTPTPSAPDPVYTIVPGRAYLVVASAGAGGAGPPEAWDMQFAGRNPSRDHFLNETKTSDVFSAAVGLYVFLNSPGNGETAYDDWNFNTLVNWYNVLVNSPNAQETTLLNDIAAQSAANNTLYPITPLWDPSHPTNATIKADLKAVGTSGDPAIPTPCPAGCTGTPTP